MTTTDNHGLDQAKAQAESIVAMIAATQCDYDRLQELRAERADLTETLDDQEHPDEIRAASDALAYWDNDNTEELNNLEHAAGDCTDQDEAAEILANSPLSVEVRSGWDVVGGDLSAEEFRIVLCTGGPHVEIRGELDNGTPSRAWMLYQDWGTPRTQYFDIEQSTLLSYCQEFYFEG
jgi:hypothetical protein